MAYLMSFLEGIITFISPCMLPMLPIYLSYFAGMEGGRRRTVINALGFVLGFSLVFTVSGAFAGAIGGWLVRYNRWISLVGGAVVVLLGLFYTGLLRLPFLQQTRRFGMAPDKLRRLGFFSSVAFGIIFSVGWTPCTGAMWGSALMLAASSGHAAKGVLMLFLFSAGLGLPFLLSAFLLDQLKSAFAFIKRHYRIVNAISGGLLIVTGLAMMTGLMGRLLNFLAF